MRFSDVVKRFLSGVSEPFLMMPVSAKMLVLTVLGDIVFLLGAAYFRVNPMIVLGILVGVFVAISHAAGRISRKDQ